MKEEDLHKIISHILEECRMVLPGIQALFGFQLIAIFNARFWEGLDSTARLVHLVAVLLVALSVALVMTPAAYHRQALRHGISRFFVDFASTCVLLSMIPLLLGIVAGFYLIANMILADSRLAFGLSLLLFLVYTGLWFVLPRILTASRHAGQLQRVKQNIC